MCLLPQLLSKVTHMLQFLHQMFNLFALLTQAGDTTDQWRDRWNQSIISFICSEQHKKQNVFIVSVIV